MNSRTRTLGQASLSFFKEHEYLCATIQGLREQNLTLAEENKKLSIRIQELEERLNTNSSNSSKAPSQDPFHEARHSQPSGRKPGGQPNHPRHTRKMVPLEQINRIVEITPESCPRCGTGILGADSILITHRQVVELTTVSPDVTQYNIHTSRCKVCGKQVRAKLPQEAKKGFGPRLMAFLTMLSGEANVTKRKICTIMNHLGIKISLGAVCNIHRLAGALLQKPFEEIRRAVLQSSNINADESSWRYKHNRCWLSDRSDSDGNLLLH